jgi:hypothetical protein
MCWLCFCKSKSWTQAALHWHRCVLGTCCCFYDCYSCFFRIYKTHTNFKNWSLSASVYSQWVIFRQGLFPVSHCGCPRCHLITTLQANPPHWTPRGTLSSGTLSVAMNVCSDINTYTYICIYIYIYSYICVYTHMYMYMYMIARVSIYIYIYVYIPPRFIPSEFPPDYPLVANSPIVPSRLIGDKPRFFKAHWG